MHGVDSSHLKPMAMWSSHFARFPSSNELFAHSNGIPLKLCMKAWFYPGLLEPQIIRIRSGSMQKCPLNVKGMFGSTFNLGYGHQYLVLCDAVACNECRRVHWKSLCVEMRQPSLFSKHTMILGLAKLHHDNSIETQCVDFPAEHKKYWHKILCEQTCGF